MTSEKQANRGNALAAGGSVLLKAFYLRMHSLYYLKKITRLRFIDWPGRGRSLP